MLRSFIIGAIATPELFMNVWGFTRTILTGSNSSQRARSTAAQYASRLWLNLRTLNECAIASRAMKPTLCRVSSYSDPGLPSPAIIIVFTHGILLSRGPISSCERLTGASNTVYSVSYTHLRAHETRHDLVCRLLLEKKKK